MRSLVVGLLLVAARGGHAIAQAPGSGPVEQPLGAFLEQRVAEELATDGMLLSRLGVSLEIEIIGETVLVTLVDSTTRRAVASTKVDRVSGDREATVAQVTLVAGSLVEQIAHASGPAKPGVVPDQTDHDVRSAGEYQYRQQELTFAPGAWGEQAPFRGAMRRPLSEVEFFNTVDRPDLSKEYLANRRQAKIGFALSGITLGASVANFALHFNDHGDAESDAPAIVTVSLFGLGVVGLVVSTYLITHAMPVEQSEVYDLANTHNKKLRSKYALPLGVAPYATDGGGGLSLGGGF